MAQQTSKKKTSQKPKPQVDPVRQHDLERLSSLDSMLSNFWSARSGYGK